MRVGCMTRPYTVILLTIQGIPAIAYYPLLGSRSRAYLSPLASNTMLVPPRLAFLQRSASSTVLRYALRYCIRSSIRRCLSMLRNTGDGNELALPATNA